MYTLITGCAGFIGSHLADALLEDGQQVVGIDCFSDYYDRRIKEGNIDQAMKRRNFRLIEADLITTNLPELLEEVDIIYHLAGQPGVRGSWGDQFELYARNNILATQRLLHAALNTGRIPLVYASSSSVYGNLPTMPLNEEMTPTPISPYGVSKLAAEHLCRLYSAVHGLPTISLRLFTVYGPRQRPDMAFERFFSAALRNSAIDVYGDGSQTRDFTFVADVVRAFRLAGSACSSDQYVGSVFNIAGGSRVSVNDVLDRIALITGKSVSKRCSPNQAGDVRNTWADTVRASSALSFIAQIPISQGLERQWQHMSFHERLIPSAVR